MFFGCALWCIFSWTSISSAAAQTGNVSVSPTRVVLEDGRRSAEVTLVNRGQVALTYRISLIHKRMDDQGRLIATDGCEEGRKCGDDLIRFAPRQVVLQPGVAQQVRIMARIPEGTEPGEYRSRMLFQALPRAAAPQRFSNPNGEAVRLKLDVVSGISIPAIVRVGDTKASARLSGLELGTAQDGQRRVELRLHRDGNRSIYGDFEVHFRSSAHDKTLHIGLMRGVALYTPNKSRTVAIPLRVPAGVELSDGELFVTYRKPTEAGKVVLTREKLNLP